MLRILENYKTELGIVLCLTVVGTALGVSTGQVLLGFSSGLSTRMIIAAGMLLRIRLDTKVPLTDDVWTMREMLAAS
jgi:hypothetical protein